MRKIAVYSRAGCHLCEKAISELENLRSSETFDLTTRGITEDPELYEHYRNLIPVVSVDGETHGETRRRRAVQVYLETDVGEGDHSLARRRSTLMSLERNINMRTNGAFD
jgi:hypothetical protein